MFKPDCFPVKKQLHINTELLTFKIAEIAVSFLFQQPFLFLTYVSYAVTYANYAK